MVGSSAAFEEYFQHNISHALQLSVSPTFLSAKLAQVQASKDASEAAVFSFQIRIRDLEDRLSKCKDEASMNACALRKQIEENQRLQSQFKEVSQRCMWLEEECLLYHNDRELFRGVAEEAEDRACRAEERCDAAERSLDQMAADLNDLKNLKNNYERQKEELNQVGSKVSSLEASNENLQAKLLKAEQRLAQLPASQSGPEPSAAPVFMEESINGTGMSKTKPEKTIGRERLGTPQLMAEVQRLWKEVALYKCNLARAEIQVRILDDDNKELRLALRNRMATAVSPVLKKGKTNSSPLDSTGVKQDARQPLSTLEPNRLKLR